MTMLNTTRAYRREDRAPVRVPVVLPVVEVTINEHGNLTVTLDGEPCTADDTLGRDQLRYMVDTIATDLRSPVRVEVHEHDGTSFTDIITPTPEPEGSSEEPAPDTTRVTADAPSPPVHAVPTRVGPGTVLASVFGIAGEGFTPGEDVEVYVVFARQVADEHGATHMRLPPALLADCGRVALIGRTSGTIALSEPTS